MSLYQESSDLMGKTYRVLREHAELLRQIGLPEHAKDIDRLAEEHLTMCLRLLETTDPGLH